MTTTTAPAAAAPKYDRAITYTVQDFTFGPDHCQIVTVTRLVSEVRATTAAIDEIAAIMSAQNSAPAPDAAVGMLALDGGTCGMLF